MAKALLAAFYIVFVTLYLYFCICIVENKIFSMPKWKSKRKKSRLQRGTFEQRRRLEVC